MHCIRLYCELCLAEEIDQDAEVTLVTPIQVSTQGEAHSQEDQPEDQLGVLIAAKVLTNTARRNVQTYTRRRVVSTGSGGVNTASKMISTAEESELFKATMRSIKNFVPMKSEDDKEVPKLAEARSSKRYVEQELDQGRSKKQKVSESSGLRNKDVDELSQEEIQQLMIIVPEQGMNVEALQTKYPIIDYDIYTKDSRKYWKIIRLWSLVKERFSSTKLTDEKERVLWVKLKRLFEPDDNNELYGSQKYMFDITWRLYDTCGVHHISTKKGMDIYMLVEKEYPLSRGILTQMLCVKLLMEGDSEMCRELIRKIFM
nr:hypothetical protein [Tanacetum cinerariifolium]